MSRLYVFARHAESTANAERVINSDPSHNYELTRCGRQQASRLGLQLRHLPLDRVVCTRFVRTRQTAEIAVAQRSLQLEVEPLFDEVDAGAFDGVMIEKYWSWRSTHSDRTGFPGGESICAARQRYAVGLTQLLHSAASATLVVCHEHMLRLLLLTLGEDHAAGESVEVGHAAPFLFNGTAIQAVISRLRTGPTLIPTAMRESERSTVRH